MAEAQEGSDSGLHPPHMNPEKADFLGRKRRRRSEGTGAWSTVIGNNGSSSGGSSSGSGGNSGSFSPPVDYNGFQGTQGVLGALGSQGSQSGGSHLDRSTPTNGADGGVVPLAAPPPLIIAPKRPSLGRGVSVSDGETSLYLNPDIDGAMAMDLLQLAERVCHIAEIHLVSINRSGFAVID